MFNFKNLAGQRSADTIMPEIEDSGSMRGLSNLYDPQQSPPAHIRDVVDVLFETGSITDTQLVNIRKQQQLQTDCDVITLLSQIGYTDADGLLAAKATLYGFEFCNIDPEKVDTYAFSKLDVAYIKSNLIMPIAIQGDQLVVATCKPEDVFVIDDVKRRTEMNVKVVVCTQANIESICQALDQSHLDCSVDQIIEDASSQGDVEVIKNKEQENEDLEKIAAESPIIKFVNYLISHAMREGASDIHIEPKETHTKIRYRIDGILLEAMKPPSGMHSAVVSRLKIMSNLDISERRVPQDGRISAKVGGREIDLRISTLPTNFGEKVVIRILDSRSILRGLDELGMMPEALAAFRAEIDRPHGIILVTGPTGSGKTTTLYSAMNHMDGAKMNISTVEDPIEYHLDFANQVQVIEKIGLSFAAALRSLLRQDPDIIMLGEIRDDETARIAVQAALTGHLVLSTLHTNDAPSSITRLVDIGVEPYLIAASLNSILAQRLVRKICSKCKTNLKVPENMKRVLAKAGIAEQEIFHGAGCDACHNSGYAGRVGLYELLLIEDTFRDMITTDASLNNMRRAFASTKQASLYDDGIRKVKMGLTTLEEVLRVTEAYDPQSPVSQQVCLNEPESVVVKSADSTPIQMISANPDGGAQIKIDDLASDLINQSIERVAHSHTNPSPYEEQK